MKVTNVRVADSISHNELIEADAEIVGDFCNETHVIAHLYDVVGTKGESLSETIRASTFAQLFTAAPDLLEACEAMLAYHRWAKSEFATYHNEPPDPGTACAAAIKKAKGES